MAPPAFAPFPVTVLPDGDTRRRMVVALRGEHDLATKAALDWTLTVALAMREADLVLDMSEVTFADASTLGVVVHANNIARDRASHVWLRSPSPQLRRVLGLCGLDDLVEPTPAVDEFVDLRARPPALASSLQPLLVERVADPLPI